MRWKKKITFQSSYFPVQVCVTSLFLLNEEENSSRGWKRCRGPPRTSRHAARWHSQCEHAAVLRFYCRKKEKKKKVNDMLEKYEAVCALPAGSGTWGELILSARMIISRRNTRRARSKLLVPRDASPGSGWSRHGLWCVSCTLERLQGSSASPPPVGGSNMLQSRRGRTARFFQEAVAPSGGRLGITRSDVRTTFEY